MGARLLGCPLGLSPEFPKTSQERRTKVSGKQSKRRQGSEQGASCRCLLPTGVVPLWGGTEVPGSTEPARATKPGSPELGSLHPCSSPYLQNDSTFHGVWASPRVRVGLLRFKFPTLVPTLPSVPARLPAALPPLPPVFLGKGDTLGITRASHAEPDNLPVVCGSREPMAKPTGSRESGKRQRGNPPRGQ